MASAEATQEDTDRMVPAGSPRLRSLVVGAVAVLVVAVALVARMVLPVPVADRAAAKAQAARQHVQRAAAAALRVPMQFRDPLPGMPPVIGDNVYSQTHSGDLSPAAQAAKPMIYVPDSLGTTVTEINPRTRKIVRRIETGYLSQHVVPSYDLSTLNVNASAANRIDQLDPTTGKKIRTIHVPRPYNLYYTPDGKYAVVMEEQHNLIKFDDPRTFKTRFTVAPQGCRGPNHADFSANGRFFVVTCEFSGTLVKISTLRHKVIGRLQLGSRPTAKHASQSGLMGMAMPQDIRLAPNGLHMYVADMGTNEVRIIDPFSMRQVGAIGMPEHPHGIYPSRNAKRLYVSDRGAGEVSVINPTTNKIVNTWVIPGGGSPDMGGVTADGRFLWLSGRYNGVVYVFNTKLGKLVDTITVGGSPHGLAVWPQPGRYSLGHTGNMR